MTDISIVVPAYNEEARIESVLLNFCGRFPEQEIIVVCNGCNDRTHEIVEAFHSKHPQIKALHFNEKLGKGGAIIEGFKAAQGESIGFADADDSVEPDEIEKMFAALANADGVIASRRLSKSIITVQQPFMRRFSSRAFNIIVRAIFGLNFKDTQCGVKVFKKEAIKGVLPSLTTKGFEFDVELLWKLSKGGCKVVEFPVVWKHSQGSTFSLSNAPHMFFSLLKMRFCK
ncbi:MAG: dolichyl-phosphate beta-glucosyltransferase [Chloroflexota bacterium]|nr:dolichyl-phosphate beta-glucosyltransferase [Chloroflexota bacterium]